MARSASPNQPIAVGVVRVRLNGAAAPSVSRMWSRVGMAPGGPAASVGIGGLDGDGAVEAMS